MDKEVGWWVALARMGAAQWEMGAVGEHPSSELNAKASVCVFFSAWWGVAQSWPCMECHQGYPSPQRHRGSPVPPRESPPG